MVEFTINHLKSKFLEGVFTEDTRFSCSTEEGLIEIRVKRELGEFIFIKIEDGEEIQLSESEGIGGFFSVIHQ